MVARAFYRSRQFVTSLRPRVDAELRDEAFRYLNERERGLFATMTRRDQQHCLDVYRRLIDRDEDDRELLAASLLHDAGKGRVTVWQRVAFVLLEATAPNVLERLARPGEGPHPGEGRGWREALYRCRHHPELGAKLARMAGSSDEVVALIGEQDVETLRERLAALHAADDAA